MTCWILVRQMPTARASKGNQRNRPVLQDTRSRPQQVRMLPAYSALSQAKGGLHLIALHPLDIVMLSSMQIAFP